MTFTDGINSMVLKYRGAAVGTAREYCFPLFLSPQKKKNLDGFKNLWSVSVKLKKAIAGCATVMQIKQNDVTKGRIANALARRSRKYVGLDLRSVSTNKHHRLHSSQSRLLSIRGTGVTKISDLSKRSSQVYIPLGSCQDGVLSRGTACLAVPAELLCDRRRGSLVLGPPPSRR